MTELSHEVVSRVAFGYESLMYAAEWLVENHESHDSQISNAHVDSFVLHARRLVDVLSNKRNHADDLISSDLVEQPPTVELPVSNEYRDRMNKRVLHLTTHDEPETVAWPVRDISREIGKAMDLVIDRMEKEGSPYFDRFETTRNGGLGFRKTIMLGPPD